MSIDPVRKSVVVKASQDRAFAVFTNGIDRWWPRQHHVGTSPMKTAVLEPRQGGRWYATCEDGSECDTGKVLSWEPPHRVLLAWQLTAQWQFDPDFVTEVEVTFTAQGPRETLVVLEHRNLERFGDTAPEIARQVAEAGGWPLLLDLFARAAETTETNPNPKEV
ncbi:MAG TPA: SRPBCC family protein [Polyangia bacterium]